MADELDVYLANSAAKPTGSRDALDEHLASQPAAQMPDKGALDAFGRTALQGASAGFFDELASGIKALVDTNHPTRGGPTLTEAYHKNVDEERAKLHAAEEQHPVASTLGNLAGGAATALVPGAGLAGLGRGFAANAARGAAYGIASGAGTSEKSDLPGIVQDAAKSGLVGGAVGGVLGTAAEKILGGAPAREDARVIQNVTGGRATSAGKKVYADDELVTRAVQRFGLKPQAADPAGLAEAVKTPLEQVGAQLGAARQAIGANSLGVRTADVTSAVNGVKSGLEGPSGVPLRKAVDTYLGRVEEAWGGSKRITVEQLNTEIGKLEKVGFGGAPDMDPGAAKQLTRDLAGALENVLQKRYQEVSDLGEKLAASSLGQRPAFAGMADAAKAAKELPDLNADYRGLKLIQRAAEDRANLPPANQAAGGLRNAIGHAVDMGLLFSHPAGFAAKKGLELAPRALAGADSMLARLYQASQSGQVTAQLIEQALEAGVPRGLVARFSSAVATPAEAPAQ